MLHGTSSPDAITLAFCGDGRVDADAVATDVVAAAAVDDADVEIEVGGTVTTALMDGAADPSAPQPGAMSVRMIDAATCQARLANPVTVRRSALAPHAGTVASIYCGTAPTVLQTLRPLASRWPGSGLHCHHKSGLSLQLHDLEPYRR
jgi:hypothetical protein